MSEKLAVRVINDTEAAAAVVEIDADEVATKITVLVVGEVVEEEITAALVAVDVILVVNEAERDGDGDGDFDGDAPIENEGVRDATAVPVTDEVGVND